MKLFKTRKTYYLYNPNTLSYDRVYPSARDRFFIVLRHLSIGAAIGIGVFFIMMYTIDSPVESLMKKENKLLQTQYEVLSLRLTNALMIYSKGMRTCTAPSSRPNPFPNRCVNQVSGEPTATNIC